MATANRPGAASRYRRPGSKLLLLSVWSVLILALGPACQFMAPHTEEPPALGQIPLDPRQIRDLSVASSANAQATPDSTTQVKRGTLQDMIAFSGQVVPARTAKLSFRTGGVVRAVHVRSGQSVKSGEPLIELALDDEALRNAQTQATVADLAYQSQAARVAQLKQGGGAAAAEDARANVARARAALLEAEVARDVAHSSGPVSTDVQLASLAVDQATDELNNAQEVARRNQEAEASAAADAVRTAQRRVEEAKLRLEMLQSNRANAEAARQAQQQQAQLEVDAAKDELARAQLMAGRGEEDAHQAPATAAAAVQAAEREVAAATLRVQMAQRQDSPGDRDAQLQLARLELAQAQAQRALAQQNARQNQSTIPPTSANLVPDVRAVGTSVAQPAPTPAIGATPTPGAALDLRTADLQVAAAAQKVQALSQPPQQGPAAEQQLAQLQLDAAQDQLARAQAAAQQTVQRTEQDDQTGMSDGALAVRAAQRRLQDATLRLQQVQAAATSPATQSADDPEVRLAQLNLAQTQDDLAAAQARADLVARGESATGQAATASTAFTVRAAERKLSEATLRLQQARAKEQTDQASGNSQQGVADLRVAAAQDALQAAQAHLNELQTGSTSAETLRNEERRAELLQSEALAARSQAQPVITLTAPFDGTVASVDVTENQAVEPQTTVARLDDPGRLSVVASASQWEVSRLSTDQPVVVDFPGVAAESVHGTIVDLSTAAVRDGDRSGFPVRIDLDQIPATVRVGMTASVNVAVQADNVLYVPSSAVHTVGTASVVTRIAPDGTRQDVPVVLGTTFGNNIEIVSGLKEQDTIAARPLAVGPGTLPAGAPRAQPASGDTVANAISPANPRQAP